MTKDEIKLLAERHERDQMAHMSDDCKLVWVVEHDDEGEPMFPGGLR